MFLNIKVENFKSLNSFTFNLEEKKDSYKNAALIYGENGAGKSNIVSIFQTLSKTFQTMSMRRAIDEFFFNEEETSSEEILRFLRSRIPDIPKIIKQSKTIGSKEDLRLDFRLLINNQVANYTLGFNEIGVSYEKLEYVLDKNRTVLFEFDSGRKYINPKIFINEDYSKEFMSKIEKFWSKHTFFSILFFEITETNFKFIKKNIHENLLKVLDSFVSIKCYGVNDNPLIEIEREDKSYKIPLSGEFMRGEIEKSSKRELEKATNILTYIFTGLYSDIKSLFYETEELEDGKIKYELFLKKVVGEKILEIPFSLESKGTKNLLKLIPNLISAIKGDVVIIDEFDNGIHDLMVKEIFEELIETTTGQLIITTHNTLLLETEIDNKYLYMLKVDVDGVKNVESLDKDEDRVHKNHNRRLRYLKGLYHAVPMVGNLDFDLILEELEDDGDEE